MGAFQAGFFSDTCHRAALFGQMKFEIGFFKVVAGFAQRFFKQKALGRQGPTVDRGHHKDIRLQGINLGSIQRVRGGMGWWSHRAALACALAVWSSMFVAQIFDFEERGTGAVVVCTLALVAAGLVLSLHGRFQDYVSLCLATLAVNVLLLSAAARVLVSADIGGLLIFSLVGLACLGGSVRWLVSVQQRMRKEQV